MRREAVNFRHTAPSKASLQVKMYAQNGFQGATSTVSKEYRSALPRRQTLCTNSRNPKQSVREIDNVQLDANSA
ncbi:MAG: hypothetical protein A2Z03_07925 [Chloroflexi bacterium RBG_16_56_8]|nr:MAG: hypothetical protein A2Z03_07925 [Chloroflexi bacterium RBG_16_56_8]